MEKKTLMVIGCLILLAVIPIGVLAFTDTETGPACCDRVRTCETCDGCGPDGACDTGDCTCSDSADCSSGGARANACQPSGCCEATAGCGC